MDAADNKGDDALPPRRSTGSGTQKLLSQFPYAHLTDDEIIAMYEIGGFSLGASDEIKLDVVNKFRTISKLALSSVLDDVCDHTGAQPLSSVLTDISDFVLKAPKVGKSTSLNG